MKVRRSKNDKLVDAMSLGVELLLRASRSVSCRVLRAVPHPGRSRGVEETIAEEKPPSARRCVESNSSEPPTRRTAKQGTTTIMAANSQKSRGVDVIVSRATRGCGSSAPDSCVACADQTF